jgi:hypothetical protein
LRPAAQRQESAQGKGRGGSRQSRGEAALPPDLGKASDAVKKSETCHAERSEASL